MAATATAPRTRRAPSRPAGKTTTGRSRGTARPKPRARAQRRGITPATGFAIPAAAVGRTAVAVGGLADSGLVVRLTRSRLWIGLVGALLVGIVGLNVYALSLNASGSQVAQQAEALALENSSLRAQLTERLSADEIQHAASKLGLANPMPDEIRYLRAADADVKAAAKRLLGGELGSGAAATASAEDAAAQAEAAVAPPAPAAPVEAAPVVPEATAPVDPAVAPAPAATVTP
jgi:hypothetical protein